MTYFVSYLLLQFCGGKYDSYIENPGHFEMKKRMCIRVVSNCSVEGLEYKKIFSKELQIL